MYKISIPIFSLFFTFLFSQDSTSFYYRSYSFIIKDKPSKLFTMRQFNQSYLSAYRLFTNQLNKGIKNKNISNIIQLGLHSFLLMPLTHEEGHRSILTLKKIGSISQPFFNKDGAAYVNGVTDKILKELRESDFPNYIRLHTAGLESDYMLTRRVESIGIFGLDNFNNYKWEYWLRKSQLVQYLMLGLFKIDVDIKEEKNELERDIVGLDTYGAARHLFRPNMDFYRYTKYSDLTIEERGYIKRMGYRSLLNIFNPLLFGKNNFQIKDGLEINIGLGYMLSPFGDFIDENIWIKTTNYNLEIYFRQFQNKSDWFNGGGISLKDYHLSKNIIINTKTHYWQQPKNLNFNSAEKFSGWAIDQSIGYYFFSDNSKSIRGFSIDSGLIYKTKGFLPEELYLTENIGIRFGTTIILN